MRCLVVNKCSVVNSCRHIAELLHIEYNPQHCSDRMNIPDRMHWLHSAAYRDKHNFDRSGHSTLGKAEGQLLEAVEVAEGIHHLEEGGEVLKVAVEEEEVPRSADMELKEEEVEKRNSLRTFSSRDQLGISGQASW
jgi:hypothetical protein